MCYIPIQYLITLIVLYFVVFFIITWVIFSIIVMIGHPTFINADGNVNWWNSFWVIVLTEIIAIPLVVLVCCILIKIGIRCLRL